MTMSSIERIMGTESKTSNQSIVRTHMYMYVRSQQALHLGMALLVCTPSSHHDLQSLKSAFLMDMLLSEPVSKQIIYIGDHEFSIPCDP